MIKRAEKCQFPDIMEIWLEGNMQAHPFIEREYWMQHWQVMEEEYLPESEAYVAEEAGEVLGFVGVMQGYFIGGLFVKKEAMRKGIGRSLVEECQKRYQKLALGVYQENRGAYFFYRALGFTVSSEQMEAGTGHREYTMCWERPPIIYDISRELFSSRVFPGDPVPSIERVLSLDKGDICSLSQIQMGTHSGTHLDAPGHFCPGGRMVDQLDLGRCIGLCTVAALTGSVTEADLLPILEKSQPRLLLKGELTITEEAAHLLNQYHIQLLGVEGFTVGNEDNLAWIHQILLSREVVILETLQLEQVPEGTYQLNTAPILYGGADGAQCRPVLIQI